MQDRNVEQYSEAVATVISKCVSGVFRILWAIISGILNGLMLMPVLRGFKRAINAELTNLDKE